ncbi:hypothetical protein TgHK011_001536 [Trichoderma gracile]|nr:hypothetical protein TgHK011_001536 [Trichoderma gracile]
MAAHIRQRQDKKTAIETPGLDASPGSGRWLRRWEISPDTCGQVALEPARYTLLAALDCGTCECLTIPDPLYYGSPPMSSDAYLYSSNDSFRRRAAPSTSK